MPEDLAAFPDLEGAVIELVADIFADGSAGVLTPPNLKDHAPYVRVTRSGGSDDRITDTGRINIDVFAVDRSDALSFAEQVRQRLIASPHTLSHCVIDRAETNLSPSVVPYGNPNLSLVTATYTVTTRRNS